MTWTSLLVAQLPPRSKAQVILRGQPFFEETTQLFNHAVKSPASAVVRVTTAEDVSAIVTFARAHSLSISVKGGGFNTAGWAVQGDIIIDLFSLSQVDVHKPDERTGKVVVQPLGPPSAGRTLSGDRGKKRGETEAFGDEGGAGVGCSISPGAKAWKGVVGGTEEGVDIQRFFSDNGTKSPLSLDNLPLPCRTTHTSMDTQPSRPSSSASSSSLGARHGSGSGGELSIETAATSGPSRESSSLNEAKAKGDRKGKGRERVVSGFATMDVEQERRDSGMECGSLFGALSQGDKAIEGTRSWVEGQVRDDTTLSSPAFTPAWHDYAPAAIPSFATLFFNRPPPVVDPAIPFATSTGFSPAFDPYAHPPLPPFSNGAPSNSSITSNGFAFNPTTMAGPSSAGFTFNPSALASSSSLGSSVLPLAPPVAPTPLTFAASTNPAPSVPPSIPSSAPIALVTIGAGAKSQQIDAVTAPFSYHVPLAAYPVGCAIFASGGFGFLSRLHGLSMDNVVQVELVVPDGRIIYLSEEDERAEGEEGREKRELWWAFRGAGITVAIVTRIRVKAYQVGLVYSGNLIYPFNPITTPSLIKHWRDCCKNAPRELYMNLILTAGPDPSSHVVVIQLCYLGARSVGDQFLQSIMSWEGERCLLKDVETRTFLTQQDSVLKVLSAQAGNRWCIRANLMNSLPDECIHQTVAAFKNIPERSAWLFEIAAGAIADPLPSSSCFPASHRSAPFQVAAIHQWKSQAQDDLWTTTARRWIDNVISPHSPGGSFPCFLESKEGLASVRKCFGDENWKRLVEVKRRFDPENALRNTFWPDEVE